MLPSPTIARKVSGSKRYAQTNAAAEAMHRNQKMDRHPSDSARLHEVKIGVEFIIQDTHRPPITGPMAGPRRVPTPEKPKKLPLSAGVAISPMHPAATTFQSLVVSRIKPRLTQSDCTG